MPKATIDLEERVEELENENDSLYAGIEEALKALDNDDAERAAELLHELLDEESTEEEPED